MNKTEKMDRRKAAQLSSEPAALAGEYLRSFAQCLSAFSDFDQFLERLGQMVGDDLYLEGSAALCDPFRGDREIPDFEQLKESETVIAVAGETGNSGFLKYSGRVDGKPFGAEDLHLMGAVAGFLSSLVAQAEKHRQKEHASQVLQYLINQLPLGVVCFGADGRLIVENNIARRLLGDAGTSLIEGHLGDVAKNKQQRIQLHFEVGGKLVFSEGRALKVDPSTQIHAFVLYDMSSSRDKLLLELEREAYLSESRGAPLSLVILESKDEAGAVYRKMKAVAGSVDLPICSVQPLDAYACACVFRGLSPREVRAALKQLLGAGSSEVSRASVVGYESTGASEAPAQELLEAGQAALAPLADILLPDVLVLDAYDSVAESLEMLVAEHCALRPVSGAEEAIERIAAGDADAIFLDLDGFSGPPLERLRAVIAEAGDSFQLFYTSFKQPQAVRQQFDLSKRDCILQKPFDAEAVAKAVADRFD